MDDGSRQAILCHIGRKKVKIKTVCPALVGGKKRYVGKVDLVRENLEHFRQITLISWWT